MAVKAVPFHSKEYWESRFDKENHFEWLSTWSTLHSHVEPYLDPNEPILHLGKVLLAFFFIFFFILFTQLVPEKKISKYKLFCLY